jgi:hypothetical protein
MIYGPKDYGAYVVEFTIARRGRIHDVLPISIPRTEPM